jgi:hypothetical protein
MRIVRLDIRNPVVALLLAFSVIAVAGLLLFVGVTLLLGLLAAATIAAGSGWLYRRLTGGTFHGSTRPPMEIDANAEILPRDDGDDRRLPPA